MQDEPNTHCLNCGTLLAGRFCSTCGQKDLGTRVDLKELVGEFVSETFEIEGRLPRTLVSVIFKPGDYLYRFLAGQRRSFSSPLRLYLLAVFVSVLVTGWRVDGAARRAIASGDLVLVPDETGNGLTFSAGSGIREMKAEERADAFVREMLEPEHAPECRAWEHLGPRWWGECEPQPFDWVDTLVVDRSLECVQEGEGIEKRIQVGVDRLIRSGSDTEIASTLFKFALEQVPLAMSLMIGVFAGLLKLFWWRHPTTVHVLVAVTFHALVLYGVTLWMFWPVAWLAWLVHGWLQAHALFSLKAAYGSSWPRTFAAYFSLGAIWSVMAVAAAILAIAVGLWNLAGQI